MTKNAHVPLPNIVFSDGTPLSPSFDDVYFSRDGGIDESEYVFLLGNGLPERWINREGGEPPFVPSALTPALRGSPSATHDSFDDGAVQPPSKHFTLAELGFGTGLNFLVTWRAFLQTSGEDQQLHYIAIEQFPLTHTMLAEALALQPDLAEYALALIDAYPLRLPGLHRIHLGRVTLTLCVGDASEILKELDATVDAWFLDGFSPAKNPDMWSEEVLAQISRISAPGTSFATFTVARAVREGFTAQGFTFEKKPGFGHKREMLVGIKKMSEEFPRSADDPREPERSERGGAVAGAGRPLRQRRHTTILGAGIAGASLARALAERGMQVTVLEAHTIASGASGNVAGVLFPQLAKRWGVMGAWYFAAYSFMLQQLPCWGNVQYQQPGMLRLPRHDAEAEQLKHVNETLGLDASMLYWLERDAASAQAGVALASGAAFFPQGTWLNPAQCCASLLQHEKIKLHENTAAISITKKGNEWLVRTVDGREFASDVCAITTAHQTSSLLPQHHLPLGVSAGQVSIIPASATATPLRSILCHKGYVIPAGDHYLIGATYDHEDVSGAVTAANHQHNMDELSQILPHWFSGEVVGGRTALRATTPDRLPYIGAVEAGLFVSVGHGSRGLLSAPLAAEIIASEIVDEQVPVTRELRRAIRPLRFIKK